MMMSVRVELSLLALLHAASADVCTWPLAHQQVVGGSNMGLHHGPSADNATCLAVVANGDMYALSSWFSIGEAGTGGMSGGGKIITVAYGATSAVRIVQETQGPYTPNVTGTFPFFSYYNSRTTMGSEFMHYGRPDIPYKIGNWFPLMYAMNQHESWPSPHPAGVVYSKPFGIMCIRFGDTTGAYLLNPRGGTWTDVIQQCRDRNLPVTTGTTGTTGSTGDPTTGTTGDPTTGTTGDPTTGSTTGTTGDPTTGSTTTGATAATGASSDGASLVVSMALVSWAFVAMCS
jgi:hypothetical protein